jgi:hypothetical protein
MGKVILVVSKRFEKTWRFILSSRDSESFEKFEGILDYWM